MLHIASADLYTLLFLLLTKNRASSQRTLSGKMSVYNWLAMRMAHCIRWHYANSISRVMLHEFTKCPHSPSSSCEALSTVSLHSECIVLQREPRWLIGLLAVSKSSSSFAPVASLHQENISDLELLEKHNHIWKWGVFLSLFIALSSQHCTLCGRVGSQSAKQVNDSHSKRWTKWNRNDMQFI